MSHNSHNNNNNHSQINLQLTKIQIKVIVQVNQMLAKIKSNNKWCSSKSIWCNHKSRCKTNFCKPNTTKTQTKPIFSLELEEQDILNCLRLMDNFGKIYSKIKFILGNNQDYIYKKKQLTLEKRELTHSVRIWQWL